MTHYHMTEWECNGYNDSDWFMVCYDDVTDKLTRYEIGTTRFAAPPATTLSFNPGHWSGQMVGSERVLFPTPEIVEKARKALVRDEVFPHLKKDYEHRINSCPPVSELKYGLRLRVAKACKDVFVSKNETSFSLLQKDSDSERGKKMCVGGSLIEISKELDAPLLFGGILMDSNGHLYHFLAAHSTGNLVENSYARFCGVVTGKYDYDNSGGGVGHAANIVGVFDLPSNH